MEILGNGNFFRSAEMEYISIIMQEHLAHDAVEQLADLAAVQFTDLNGELTAFKRHYTPFIRRCDDTEKRLRFFEDEMRAHGIEAETYTQAEMTQWLSAQRTTLATEGRGVPLLDFWENLITDKHREYQAIKTERERTAAQLYEAVQRRHVIEKAAEFFLVERASAGRRAMEDRPADGPLLRMESGRAGVVGLAGAEEDEMQFKHIAGIIATDDKVRFARIVFRVTSGHAVVRFADIATPLIDEKGASHTKSVFAIFYRGRTLTGKLDRICTAFSAHQHDIPSFDNDAAVRQALDETKAVIGDSITWLEQERATSSTTLRHLALVIKKWRYGIMREKTIYHALNMFTRQPERSTVTAQAWVTKSAVSTVHDRLRDAHLAAAQGGRLQPFYMEVLHGPNLPTPPTFFPTNKVTKVFQGIVNTYGIPQYGEANPALFSLMTFPFLFGVMYGDIGHATILLAFASYLVLKEDDLGKKQLHEIFAMAFKGRYMLFFMGLFSIYCGAIYNDWFAIPINAFNGTRWVYPVGVNGTVAHEAMKSDYNDVYPFGIDPSWHAADNSLLFSNSLKMKMAVILGIVQMTFGLLLRLSNALHYKDRVELLFVCIPQLVFMMALFGYMVLLIVLKWSIDWNDPGSRPGAPPSLIDTLINLVLKPGTVNDPMFAGQTGFQTLLLLVVFFCVPIMLAGKPLAIRYGWFANRPHAEDQHELLAQAPAGAAGTGVVAAGAAGAEAHAAHDAEHSAHGGHDEHSFGEVFIHSAIETIEFVLGSVSNTASYLRLWALSLAHSQLSTVFWERAMVATIEMNSFVFVIIGFAVWASVSLGVLLIMDVLECFLHALRLHWVEFMNKHYKGNGVAFTPLAFKLE